MFEMFEKGNIYFVTISKRSRFGGFWQKKKIISGKKVEVLIEEDFMNFETSSFQYYYVKFQIDLEIVDSWWACNKKLRR